jgi:hypothetical protein
LISADAAAATVPFEDLTDAVRAAFAHVSEAAA